MRQPLVFNAFAMNCVSHIQHGQWRHPQTRQLEYTALDPWVELAQILEGGGFDALFLADVVGVYETYRADPDLAIREALQIPSNDPSLLIPAMARATRHLGFAYTSSVYQEHPFNFARRASTLDHLTDGRVAWNIVTSYLPNAARNFGQQALLSGEERYAQFCADIGYTGEMMAGAFPLRLLPELDRIFEHLFADLGISADQQVAQQYRDQYREIWERSSWQASLSLVDLPEWATRSPTCTDARPHRPRHSDADAHLKRSVTGTDL